MKRYLVSYDVADSRRLVRVHKTCKDYGISLQYSVFLAELSRNRLEALVADLRAIITDEDDIRIYPLQNRADGLHIGKTRFPEDMILGKDAEWSAILEGGE